MNRTTLAHAISTGLDHKVVTVWDIDFVVFYYQDMITYIFENGANVSTYISDYFRDKIKAAIS